MSIKMGEIITRVISDSTMEKVLTLHAVDPCMAYDILYVTLSTARIDT